MKNFKKTLLLTFGLISIVLVSIIVFNTKDQIQASIDCCYHECHLTDANRCNGNTVQKCGECDSDAYNDWCDSTTCSGGDICQNGICQIPTSACFINCSTSPGCRSSLLNATVDSTKECCGAGQCYNCNTGYYWDSISASCLQNCIDNDNDGHGTYNVTHCPTGDDCDDNDQFSYPGGTETCDNKDNNCNGTVDEGCDDDHDGYCDSTMKFYNYPVLACSSTYVSDGQFGNDCNDTVNTIYFDAIEVCDTIDNDCDGMIDEGCACVNGSTQICGLSAGECQTGTSTCSGGVWGLCIGQITPVMEVCDGLDNNCDGVIDENCDNDNDDYCDCGKTYVYGSNLTAICSGTNTTDANSIANTCDCDDNSNSIYPIATEVCDTIDNNCDGTIDEGCACVNGTNQPCGSNIGECQQGTQLCTAGVWGVCTGEVISVLEICDGKDNDCDGSIDEDLSAPLNINQQGVCVGSFKICNGVSGWQDNYSSIVNYENPEISCGDGIDNDCNGSDLVCSATCPDGVCDVAGGECSTCAADCVCVNAGDTGCDMMGKSFCCGNVTGNSISDTVAGEVCDVADGNFVNMDLNGETCNSLGYTGGTLGCRWDCKNYDPSSCVGAPGTCGNNICDAGENNSNCPTECSCVDECSLLELGCIGLNNEWICGEVGDGDVCLDKIITTCESEETCNISSGICEVAGLGCTEDWTCALWSMCASGIQTRVCTDNNSCGTITSKPDEMQNCLSATITDPSDGFKVVQDGWLNVQTMALGGTEPYIYEWKNNGTIFGDDQQWQNLDPSAMSIGNHTISVQVEDANSAIVNDSITIEILPAGTLTAQIQMWQTEFARNSMMGAIFGVDTQGGTAPYTFQWNSNIEGDFSTEQWSMIDVSSWALGTHTITSNVTDSASSSITNTIDIEIVEMFVDINNPSNGETFIFGENINFGAMVQGGTMPYTFQWMSDKDGDITPITDPKDWFLRNDLSEGTHIVTFTVTDISVTPIYISKQIHITINPAPILTAVINSPINNSIYAQGYDISFQSGVSGGVWPYTYIWNSNIDGEIKNGQLTTDKDFIKNNLSVGNHTIAFTVKDESGQVATETINLTITDSNPIIANITSPNTGDNFYEGDSVICFISNASGGVSPYAYQWNSNIDGNISDKDEFCSTNLSQGNHIITLNITDQNGDAQSDTVNIILNPELNFINTKDMSKYSAKETFLISQKNWQDVLSLTPIAVWQGNKYPLLVYHEEGNIDIDSTIHFMQMYEPDHLTTIGTMHWRVNPLLVGAQPTGANLNTSNISNIDFNLTNYLSYWNSINSVVVVDYDNYQAGLMATVFASYKNAPIIFINSANLIDYQTLIDSNIVYTVGDLDMATQSYINGNAETTINYSLEELQKWYIIETNTDKMISVNVNDLNYDYTQPGPEPDWYSTDKGGVIYTLLNRLSLAAPYLAAAKQEVIRFAGDNLGDLSAGLLYKTYMGANNTNGSIVGISSADTFSYSARSIFYDELFNKLYPSPLYKKFSISASLSCSPSVVKDTTNNIVFIEKPFNSNDYPFSVLENKQFNVYYSHGYYSSWSCGVFKGPAGLNYNNIPYLDLSWGSAGSCLTGAFHGTVSFGYNWLRKGGMAYWGATREINLGETSYGDIKPFEEWRNNPNIDLGNLAKNIGGPYVMYGDPTLSLIYRGGSNRLPSSLASVGTISGMRTNKITINSGDIAYLSCFGSDYDGNIMTYDWDFDNNGTYSWNTTNNNEEITHIYNTPGVYKPHCRTIDNDGGQAITFAIINVN